MSNKIKKKQIENQAQQGRSMVEMLGVLAIIGVLSIGGIAGYRMAMNRYQANQIANEINLMRTDAKMKVARGVDELLLGEPYDGDDGHLNFGSNYGVKVAYPVIISGEEGEEDGEEGYSFTLSGIPAGVCKPLTTLLWSMNDTASLKVNEDYYDDESAGNECDQDENKIEVAFSTKDIGGVRSGSGNPEEPEPPVTDPADEPQDNDPVPAECPRGTTLSDDGNECTCEDTEKTCNGGCCAGCTGGKVWTGRKCACPAGAEESGDDGEECACSNPAKPHWTGTECTECPGGSTWDSTTGECECEDGKVWKESVSGEDKCVELVGECEDNVDCGPGEYCYLYNAFTNCAEFKSGTFGKEDTHTSKCRKAEDDIVKEGPDGKFVLGKATAGNTDSSSGYMNWWSAERFCKALGRPQATRESIGCGEVSSGSNCSSETLTTLQTAGFSGDVWLEGYGNSCRVYRVGFSRYVSNHGRSDADYALCE